MKTPIDVGICKSARMVDVVTFSLCSPNRDQADVKQEVGWLRLVQRVVGPTPGVVNGCAPRWDALANFLFQDGRLCELGAIAHIISGGIIWPAAKR